MVKVNIDVFRLLTLALFSSVLFYSCQAEKEDILYTKEDFTSNVGKKNLFIMFFAPWCSHCKTLYPVWNELADNYNAASNLAIAKVDCTVQTELCSNQDITGYPTLKLYKINENEGKRFRGSRDLVSLQNFIRTEVEDLEEVSDENNNIDSDDLIELNETTFLEQISIGNHFIKLYAPWCGHCQDLAPTWHELAKALKDKDVIVSKLDCTKNKNICSALDVVSYPTLLWMQEGKKAGTYQGARSLGDLLKYASNMLQPADSSKNSDYLKSPTEVEKLVVSLYEEDFMAQINNGITFVKFFAPWCGHCKRMAPTWTELAKRLSSKGNIKIADVDCTHEENKELCNEQKVNGYPTLYLYRNGVQISEYNGSRELEDLLEFVKQHSGTSHDEL